MEEEFKLFKKMEPKIEIIKKNKEYEYYFKFSKVKTHFVNLIRRLILEEVPVMAIEDVEFRKNESALYDEMLAHRLGLIPLKTDLKTYNLPEQCECNGAGCAKCTVILSLKVKAQNKPTTIYANELKSSDPSIKPVYDNMPIVKLINNQEIELEAKAILGKGKDHAKFMPGFVYYHEYFDIDLKKADNPNNEIVCPKGIISKDLKLKDDYLCDYCGHCEKYSVKVKPKTNEFVFYIESFGQLSVKDILKEASNQGVKLYDEILSLL